MKKITAVLLALALLAVLSLSAFAAAPEDLINPILFKAEKGTPTVDGVLDEAYKASTPIPVQFNGYDRVLPEGHATAVGYTLWDENFLYVFMDVNDSTVDDVCDIDVNTWDYDSVEIYIDVANEKAADTLVDSSEYAAQLRIMRHATFDTVPTKGLAADTMLDGATHVSVEKEDGSGYYVEASFKLTGNSKIVGFTLQVNDDMDNNAMRDADVYVRPAGVSACTRVGPFDALELVGSTATNGMEDDTIVYDEPSVLDTVEPNATAPFTPAEPVVSEEPASSEAPAETSSADVAPESEAPTSSLGTLPTEGETGWIWIVAAVVVVVIIAVAFIVSKSKKKD